MLLPLAGRRLYFDLTGPETGPVVCITHSLASDGGSWAEQVPALLGAGFRVLRLDMRGHGGSDPVPGDYTMPALAADVAAVLDALGIARVHYIGLSIGGMIGQAFALDHGHRLLSALWCDTLPASPPGAAEVWGPRIAAVRSANSLEPIADASMDRYLSPAFRQRNPGRWRQLRDTVVGTTPQGYLGCAAAILDFDFVSRLPSLRLPVLVVCGEEDAGTPAADNRRLAGLVPGGRYEEIAGMRHFPNVEAPELFNRIMLGWLEAQRGAPQPRSGARHLAGVAAIRPARSRREFLSHLGEDHLRTLFGNHDRRGVGVGRGHGRHHRSVDDPQALKPVHLQPLVDDGERVAAHLAGAGRVEHGRTGLPQIMQQLVVALDIGAGEHFADHIG